MSCKFLWDASTVAPYLNLLFLNTICNFSMFYSDSNSLRIRSYIWAVEVLRFILIELKALLAVNASEFSPNSYSSWSHVFKAFACSSVFLF